MLYVVVEVCRHANVSFLEMNNTKWHGRKINMI